MKKEESSSSEEETSSEESEEEDEEEEKPVVKTPAATRTDSLLARSSQAREVADTRSTPSARSGYSSPSYKGSFDRDNSPKYGSSASTTATTVPHRVRPTPMHTEPEENRYSGSR